MREIIIVWISWRKYGFVCNMQMREHVGLETSEGPWLNSRRLEIREESPLHVQHARERIWWT
jgi:hypothetical protein